MSLAWDRDHKGMATEETTLRAMAEYMNATVQAAREHGVEDEEATPAPRGGLKAWQYAVLALAALIIGGAAVHLVATGIPEAILDTAFIVGAVVVAAMNPFRVLGLALIHMEAACIGLAAEALDAAHRLVRNHAGRVDGVKERYRR